MTPFTESDVEQAALTWLAAAGWQTKYGPDIAPDTPTAERTDYSDVILRQRLRTALARLNPGLADEVIEKALRQLAHPPGADLVQRNRAFHRMLVDGVTVEDRDQATGAIRGIHVTVLDVDHPERNDWLAVNQMRFTEQRHSRRPDVVLFVNGLPLVVIELKNAVNAGATVWHAYHQLQTYQVELPALFALNELLIVSDGLEARAGVIGAGREWFKPWRAADSHDVVAEPQLQVVVAELLRPSTLLAFIRDFIVFEDYGGGRLVKKMAGYHQFYAVQVALKETLRAAAPLREVRSLLEASGTYVARPQAGAQIGDRRIGVIWHTQGSGKSLTMVFYAGRVIREPAMRNPTLVVLTDRNDLDDQLFATFSRCHELLRQPPVQAESRRHLRELLAVQAGGVIFTTIHKFLPETKGDRHPLLSARSNIVVIADEAHRSQYDFIDGFARHLRDALPNAAFIGFTGTPIEHADANTRAVFGDYISIYDIQRAVFDGATVPIYYESRLAKLALDEAERPRIDEAFEEVTEQEEAERKEQLKSRWAQLEAIAGAEKRLRLLAEDIVTHFERRQEALEGKAMIVCMSRRICVDLYREIVRLRPQWHADDDNAGVIKIVMTGSAADPLDWQPHIRTKPRREQLAQRFRDPADPLKLVIVRDMWLTGFDCPALHTMYLDKPMRGHTLMQAIARVNRVFRDKPGGLVVDYLGIARELREALAIYTESGGSGQAALDQREAINALIETYEICCGLFHGFDRSRWLTGTAEERLRLLPAAQEHILAQENGKERFGQAVRELTKAFALAAPADEALRIRDEVAFFQAVHAALSKRAPGEATPAEELDHAIRQIIARAIAPEGVQDIFTAAGLPKPDISILSDEFLAEVRNLPQRNLAVELLQKLLNGEITRRRQHNVVQARSFAELLEQTIRRYQNRAIETAQVIEELIALAKELRAANRRGEQLGLSEEELAFYDALETNDSAVQVLGDQTLRSIARDLVNTVRNNVTIDWTLRETARAHLRRMVKRVLRRYGYPTDKQERATQTVLEQAEALSLKWAA